VDVKDRPQRVPRPGDPFASARPAPAPPRKRKRRKGSIFFLILLLIGGFLAVSSLTLFNSRRMVVYVHQHVIVPYAVPDALPPDYPREDAKRLVRTLRDFFARAGAGQVGDDALIRMISLLKVDMADELITPQEASGLLDLAAGKTPAPAPSGGEG